jgi:hypothetical protein
MNRWRVGEDRGSKGMDGCPLTNILDLIFLTAINDHGWW